MLYPLPRRPHCLWHILANPCRAPFANEFKNPGSKIHASLVQADAHRCFSPRNFSILLSRPRRSCTNVDRRRVQHQARVARSGAEKLGRLARSKVEGKIALDEENYSLVRRPGAEMGTGKTQRYMRALAKQDIQLRSGQTLIAQLQASFPWRWCWRLGWKK